MHWKELLYQKYISSGQNRYSLYEPYKGHKPYLTYIIQNHLPKDKFINIVDLGCGGGAFIFFAKKYGYYNIKGVDVSKEQVLFAHRNGLDEVEIGDIFEYSKKLKNESIDIFLLKDVIEHLSRKELFELFEILYSKLKKNGQILAHVPNAGGIFGSKVRYGDLTHELSFTHSSLQQLALTIGFNNIECYEDVPLVYGIKSLLRRILWEILTFPFRLLILAENGTYSTILSQNLFAKIYK